MAAKSNPVVLGTTATLIYEAPTDAGAFVQFQVGNNTGTARTFTLSKFKASTGLTTQLGGARNVAANDPIGKIVVVQSLEPGDKILGAASAAAAIVVDPVIDISRSSAAKGYVPKGTYAAGTTYEVNDVVFLAATGASYISMQDGNIGNAPDSSPAHWMPQVEKGDQGDAGVAGASSLQVVRVVSTGAESYATDFENGDTIDGVVLATNNLVLRSSATAPERNGVYIVQASGAASRHGDFDTYDEHPGRMFSVQEGTTYADTQWVCTSNVGGTLNTTAITIGELGFLRFDRVTARTAAQQAQARSNAGVWQSGFVNKFRNAGHNIDMRNSAAAALTITTAGGEVSDGWFVTPTGASVTSQQVAGPSGVLAAKALKVTGNTSVTGLTIKQRIKNTDAAPLAGMVVTVQAKVRNDTGGSITPALSVNHPTVANNYAATVTDVSSVSLQACAGGALTQVAYTFTAHVSTNLGLEVIFECGNNFSSNSKSIQITDLDIRVTPGLAAGQQTAAADIPTPEFCPFAIDEWSCLEFYETCTLAANRGISAQAVSTTSAQGWWGFRRRKYAAPTISFIGTFQANDAGGATRSLSAGPSAAQPVVDGTGVDVTITGGTFTVGGNALIVGGTLIAASPL